MSNLKKDIDEILKDFVLWRTKIIDGKPVATYDKNMLSEWENKNMLSEWENKNMLSEWEREQYQPMEAVTQIINLIESVIPEPEDARKIDKGNEAYYDQAEGFRLGWTHALTIIKSKLIGGSNGTE